jgi:hypothetical protein
VAALQPTSWPRFDGRLEPVGGATAARTGVIEVISNVPGAEVFFSGLGRVGRDPVPPQRVLPGHYIVEVRAPGHAPFFREVDVGVGESVRIEAPLVRSADAAQGWTQEDTAWTLIGVGAAATIAAAVLAGLSLDRAHAANDERDEGDYLAAEGAWAGGVATAAVGGALVGAGVLLYVFTGDEGPSGEGTPVLSGGASADGGGLSATWRF